VKNSDTDKWNHQWRPSGGQALILINFSPIEWLWGHLLSFICRMGHEQGMWLYGYYVLENL